MATIQEIGAAVDGILAKARSANGQLDDVVRLVDNLKARPAVEPAALEELAAKVAAVSEELGAIQGDVERTLQAPDLIPPGPGFDEQIPEPAEIPSPPMVDATVETPSPIPAEVPTDATTADPVEPTNEG